MLADGVCGGPPTTLYWDGVSGKKGRLVVCGRFILTGTWADISEYYELVASVNEEALGTATIVDRYNIAPTQPIIMITMDGTQRTARLVRWGLVPSWVKDPGKFTLLINARSETAHEKPSFRSAMRHRRCIIPANGFYEWHREGNVRTPYYVRPAAGGYVAFAGLWEGWMDDQGSEIESAAILTGEAEGEFRTIHHRLPMVIEADDIERWLSSETTVAEARALLKHPDPGYWQWDEVDSKVNKVGNDGPENIRPVADETTRPSEEPELSDSQLSLL